jgi:geranylgeranyl pyrophosphate synthase
MRLSEGQGAELLWRDALDKRLKPLDALKIYALKTAPAFEAALFVGARLAGPVGDYANPIKLFARNVGIAFQILNDLKDWEGDRDNKLAAGGDVLGGRPTLLWALALEALEHEQQSELLWLVNGADISDAARVQRVRQLYRSANVFEKARRLVDKHQERAEAVADEIEPDELRRLLYYLVDTVLDHADANETPVMVIELPADVRAS